METPTTPTISTSWADEVEIHAKSSSSLDEEEVFDMFAKVDEEVKATQEKEEDEKKEESQEETSETKETEMLLSSSGEEREATN